MPRMQLVRRRWSHTSPRTTPGRRPTHSASGMGARRDHDDEGPRSWRARDGGGQGPEWASAPCRVCSWSGGGGRTRRRARRRGGGLRTQPRAWVRGEITMMKARAAGGHAMAAARDLSGPARHAAYAAGQAAVVAHVAAHELGAAAYAIRAVRAAEGE